MHKIGPIHYTGLSLIKSKIGNRKTGWPTDSKISFDFRFPFFDSVLPEGRKPVNEVQSPFRDAHVKRFKSGVELKLGFFCKKTLSTEFSKLICLCKRCKKNCGGTLKTISGATQFQCLVAYTLTFRQENSCWIKISDRWSSLQLGQPC